ncbi:MAG: SDR family oxidoreductase [Dehalococcoidia bacterium]|nr:SDR family oxidoreductase [Dehalococcoidia bacterium]
MDLGFRDRVAIVGGSSKGMGRAIAMALAREGASVTVCARNEGELRRAEIEIARASSQHHVLAIPADLSRDADIKRIVRSTFNRFGRIDIAVNNVGTSPLGQPSELEDREWGEALEQNFFSVVRMSREVVPYMKQQQWGRIVNRLSISVKQPMDGMGLATASRMGVVGYSKMLANELAPFNITVNNVLAGYIQTDQLSAYYENRARETGRSAEEMMNEAARVVPMGRLGRPEDVGDVIAFLASERAGYITGENVVLDGGAVRATL